MFFFGAFSGNMIYLILAISYLAGCSSLIFSSFEDQPKELKTSETASVHVLYVNQLPEISAFLYTKVTHHIVQALSEVVIVKPPIIPFSFALFIPPLLTDKSHFSGSALFSRPPPFSLV